VRCGLLGGVRQERLDLRVEFRGVVERLVVVIRPGFDDLLQDDPDL
jgi:hypothetical protein